MTIGERIKELRNKNGLTQEKLADQLGVSYQAVSKWECNISIPDVSLIEPLTKLFRITADELLGIKTNDEDKLKEKYDTAYQNFRCSRNHSSSYWWAKEATLAFPDNYNYLEWLAYAEYRLAFAELNENDPSVEYFNELTENSLRHYESIVDNCSDTDIYTKAVLGKIMVLRFLDRIDEAEWSAEFEYPDVKIKTAEQVLSLCDEGKTLLNYLANEVK